MPDSPLTIGYAGTLNAYTPQTVRKSRFQTLRDWFWTYRIHDIDFHTRSGYYLLRGIQRFKAKYPAEVSMLEVKLWGLIDAENKAQARTFGVEDIVQIEGYFPKRESAERIKACDLLFLPLETGDDPLFIPGKIFDYIRQAKPVLILGHRSDCTDILVRSGLGILVDPFDPEAIADTLHELIASKEGLFGRYQVDWAYVEANFHFRHLARQLGDVFQEVLKGK